MNDPLHYDFAVLHNRAYFADPGINIHNLDGRQDVGLLNKLLRASKSYDLVCRDKGSAFVYPYRHSTCLSNLNAQSKDNLLY